MSLLKKFLNINELLLHNVREIRVVQFSLLVLDKMGFLSAKCTSSARLDGKTAIVTGSSAGIGKYTAQDFFIRGARVIMACRNKKKAHETAEEIRVACKDMTDLGELVVELLDLSSFESIRSFAEKMLDTEEQINLLINNAGLMMCPFSTTEDGFEMQFGTNHLGHFLLTMLLLPRIIRSAPARIVTVSSKLHHSISSIDLTDINWERKKYSPLGAYRQSKLANILFSRELANKLLENGIEDVTTYSLHPGVIRTELSRHLNDVLFSGFRFFYDNVFGWTLKTPQQGAQTTIYCAVDEKCVNETGLYYSECAVKKPSEAANSEAEAKKLWRESLKLVKLEDDYNPFVKQ